MRSELFTSDHAENQSENHFALQNKKMLRVHLEHNRRVIAAAGSMVAYQGDMRFGYKGAGGVGKWLKKKISGEDAPLMTVDGSGDVFLARQAEDIFTVLLEGDAISVSSNALLAFDDDLNHDITRIRSMAGMVGGGLFNVKLSGQGTVAITTDGPPVLLDCSRQPTFVDPNAVICWSENLSPTIKNDMNLGSFIGRGSGEAFQMGFYGPGFVVVQPSEGMPVFGGESGSSGGAGNVLGGLFGS